MRRPNMSLQKTPMPTRTAPQRIRDFDEVSLGYTLAQAMSEAERCLNCPDRWCAQHCPAQVLIPEFIEQIRLGNLEAAYGLIRRNNAMPGISGRVCPQEKQCESHCTRAIKGEAVAIGALERFVADWKHGQEPAAEPAGEKKSGRVAVIGSGPAGTTCAFSLAKAGFQVTVYDRAVSFGGVPAWGIPGFALPRGLVADQLKRLLDAGVALKKGELGSGLRLEELARDYNAVFLATGAGAPRGLDVPGGEYAMQAADYLKDDACFTPGTVAVLGGGDTAVVTARAALRRGAKKAVILYRRTREQMPARRDELALALEEGAELVELAEAEELKSQGLVCRRMELCAPDWPAGPKNSRPTGESFWLSAGLTLLALGFTNRAPEGVAADERGRIRVDQGFHTDVAGVYAGGDAVHGMQSVMKAAASGKLAAASIFADLSRC